MNYQNLENLPTIERMRNKGRKTQKEIETARALKRERQRIRKMYKAIGLTHDEACSEIQIHRPYLFQR